ncbi:hypothetical protein [Bradyrhizobium sp. SYSU BS000235]|uniref:hypothetical protein n=1 Tax=Bradyrhizobium sp. SYSU BS000235 TaxID=3411332 RepID=UPI003C77C480
MAAHLTNRTWTPQDIVRLKQMVETGVSAQRASVAFRRSLVAVKSQAKKCGFPFPDERELKRKRQGLETQRIDQKATFEKRPSIKA